MDEGRRNAHVELLFPRRPGALALPLRGDLAAALRAADERRPLRELLAVDPTVAKKLRLADLDACFDDSAFLRHVPTVIARLDSLEAEIHAAR